MNANYCSKPFSSRVRVRVLVVVMIRFGGCCQEKFTRGVGLVEKKRQATVQISSATPDLLLIQ